MSQIGNAIQDVLTKGLEAAAQYKIAKLQINDPGGYVVGANGQRVATGQPGFAGAIASVPPVVWVGVAAVVAAVVLLPLLRK